MTPAGDGSYDADFADTPAVAILQTTAESSCPTSPERMFLCYFMLPAIFSPGEGSSVSWAYTGGTTYAIHVGRTVPPVGTRVVATNVRGVWVFRCD